MTDDLLKNASISNEETNKTATDGVVENGATENAVDENTMTENAENEQSEATESVATENTATENKAESTQSVEKDGPKGKKKFKLGDVAKCTLVLTVIALVAGLLLGIVNWVTYVDPDGVIAEKCTAQFGSETSVKDEKLASYDYDKNNYIESCFVAKNGEEIVGYCYYAVGGGAKDGSIELLVFIDKDGIIKEITVYEQGETAGYFDKVEKANKSKYVGLNAKTIKKLELVKNKSELEEGEVSAVSSATYTSTGYHNAVAAAVYAYRTYISEA